MPEPHRVQCNTSANIRETIDYPSPVISIERPSVNEKCGRTGSLFNVSYSTERCSHKLSEFAELFGVHVTSLPAGRIEYRPRTSKQVSGAGKHSGSSYTNRGSAEESSPRDPVIPALDFWRASYSCIVRLTGHFYAPFLSLSTGSESSAL
jgi:hypothetical protein